MPEEGAAANTTNGPTTGTPEAAAEDFFLDDSLPPSVRTQRAIEKRFGTNKAARAACMAMAGGEPLTAAQKRALFRVGRAEGVPDAAMVGVIKQTDHQGLIPSEFEMLRATAEARGVPTSMLGGFGWMGAEVAGPGCMSVILEAQARLRGQESAVDVDIDDVEAVKTLRDMVLGHRLGPAALAGYLETLTGIHEPRFWSRFASDCLAVPGSAEEMMVVQLLLGRGVAPWSPTGLSNEQQAECLLRVMDRIEHGLPPVRSPLPGPAEQAQGALALADALKHEHLDREDMCQVFDEFDEGQSNELSAHELQAVIVTLVRIARDSYVKKEAAYDAQAAAQLRTSFKSVLRHFQSDGGREALQETFDPDHDASITKEDFVRMFPTWVRQLAGEPETEPEAVVAAAGAQEEAGDSDNHRHRGNVGPELPEGCAVDLHDDDGDGGAFEHETAEASFDSEGLALTKEQQAAKKAKDKAGVKRAKTQEKARRKAQKSREKAEGKAAKAKANRKKKARKARLKRKDAVYGDSDEEPHDERGIPAPKGVREFFRFLSREGRDAPRGLAACLYICVNEKMPVALAESLQCLVIGAELDALDVAGILGLLSRGKRSKTGELAANEYCKLTQAAWAEKEAAVEAVQSEFGRMLAEYASFSGGDPLVFELCPPFGNLLRFLITESRSLGMKCTHAPVTAIDEGRGGAGVIEVTVSGGGAPPGRPLGPHRAEDGAGSHSVVGGEKAGSHSSTGYPHIDVPGARSYVQAVEQQGWRVAQSHYQEWVSTKVGRVYVPDDDVRDSTRIKERALQAILDVESHLHGPAPPAYAALQEQVGVDQAAEIAQSLAAEISRARTELQSWHAGGDGEAFDSDDSTTRVQSPRGMSTEELLATAQEEMNADQMLQAFQTYEEALAQSPEEPAVRSARDKCYRRSGARVTGRVAATLCKLARVSDTRLSEDEAVELYTLARRHLSDHFLGQAGLEGLINGGWPEVVLNLNFDKKGRLIQSGETESDQTTFENPAVDEDGEDLSGVVWVNPLEGEAYEVEKESEAAVLSYDELKVLREKEEATLTEEKAAEKRMADMEVSEVVAADEAAVKAFDTDGTQGVGSSEMDKKAQVKAAKKAAKAAQKSGQVDSKGDDSIFDAEAVVEPDFNEEVAQLSPRAADELRAFAQQYEPEFVDGMYTSLVKVLVAQAIDYHLIAAFQMLVATNQAPTPAMMEALHTLARKQGIEDESLDCLVWLWTGGIASSPEIGEAMITEADFGPMDRPEDRWAKDARGILTLSVVRATGLIKTRRNPKPFCAIRVEGHQRNTPAVSSNAGSSEWNSICNYRVVDFPSAIVEIFIFDEMSGDNDIPMGRVTFPLNLFITTVHRGCRLSCL